MRRRAPAKVNLHLRVNGRRPDGYHEVVTVLHAIDLADELEAERCAGGIDVEVVAAAGRGLPVAAGGDNLVHRAAAAFVAASGHGGGFRFRLHKRIPAGAGLGGGSSDAAAALGMCNEIAGEPLAAAELAELAAGLGADVPFFLAGGTRLATGRGDELHPCAPPPRLHFVLLLPPFGTSTRAVYEALRAPPLSEQPLRRCPEDLEGWLDPERLVNDLEPAAMATHPELAALRDSVVARGHPRVRMSGSGSTLFLAYRHRDEAEAARKDLDSLRAEGVEVVITESAADAVSGAPAVRGHCEHGEAMESRRTEGGR